VADDAVSFIEQKIKGAGQLIQDSPAGIAEMGRCPVGSLAEGTELAHERTRMMLKFGSVNSLIVAKIPSQSKETL
jgi:hypothetical protein